MFRTPQSPENSEFDPNLEMGDEGVVGHETQANQIEQEVIANDGFEAAPVTTEVFPPDFIEKFGEHAWESDGHVEPDRRLDVNAREIFSANGESETKIIQENAPEYFAHHQAIIEGFINNPNAAQYVEYRTDTEVGVTIMTMRVDGSIATVTYKRTLEIVNLSESVDGDDDDQESHNEIGGESVVVVKPVEVAEVGLTPAVVTKTIASAKETKAIIETPVDRAAPTVVLEPVKKVDTTIHLEKSANAVAGAQELPVVAPKMEVGVPVIFMEQAHVVSGGFKNKELGQINTPESQKIPLEIKDTPAESTVVAFESVEVVGVEEEVVEVTEISEIQEHLVAEPKLEISGDVSEAEISLESIESSVVQPARLNEIETDSTSLPVVEEAVPAVPEQEYSVSVVEHISLRPLTYEQAVAIETGISIQQASVERPNVVALSESPPELQLESPVETSLELPLESAPELLVKPPLEFSLGVENQWGIELVVDLPVAVDVEPVVVEQTQTQDPIIETQVSAIDFVKGEIEPDQVIDIKGNPQVKEGELAIVETKKNEELPEEKVVVENKTEAVNTSVDDVVENIQVVTSIEMVSVAPIEAPKTAEKIIEASAPVVEVSAPVSVGEVSEVKVVQTEVRDIKPKEVVATVVENSKKQVPRTAPVESFPLEVESSQKTKNASENVETSVAVNPLESGASRQIGSAITVVDETTEVLNETAPLSVAAAVRA